MILLRRRRTQIAAAIVGPAATLLLVLAAAAPKKYKLSLLRLFVRSVILSLWSTHTRNMLISSLLVSYVLSRKTRKRISLPMSLATLYSLYYHFSVRENAQIFYRASYWNTLLVEKAGLARQTFSPTFWGINRHAQTISCTVISLVEWLWSKPVHYVRESVPGWDNNDQHLDWVDEVPGYAAENASVPDGQPIIVLVHGLGDDRFHPSVMRMARLCRNRGWRVVVWSYWRFDFSESRDVQLVLNHISRRSPVSPMVAIGWSAGGHLLLNYLGKVEKTSPLVCAVALSPATDFDYHAGVIQEEESDLYYKFMGIQCQKCLRRHVQNDKRIKDPQTFLKKFSLFEFDGAQVYGKFLATSPSDDSLVGGPSHTSLKSAARAEMELRATARSRAAPPTSFSTRRRQTLEAAGLPQNDAADSRELVKQAFGVFKNYPTAAHAIDSIQIPTLIVMSQDDPVAAMATSTVERIKRNRHIILAETLRGGHIGFYEGFLPFGMTWDARTAASYIGAVLESLSQTNYMLTVFREAVKQGVLQHDTEQESLDENRPPGPSPTLAPSVMRRIISATDMHPGFF